MKLPKGCDLVEWLSPESAHAFIINNLTAYVFLQMSVNAHLILSELYLAEDDLFTCESMYGDDISDTGSESSGDMDEESTVCIRSGASRHEAISIHIMNQNVNSKVLGRTI